MQDEKVDDSFITVEIQEQMLPPPMLRYFCWNDIHFNRISTQLATIWRQGQSLRTQFPSGDTLE